MEGTETTEPETLIVSGTVGLIGLVALFLVLFVCCRAQTPSKKRKVFIQMTDLVEQDPKASYY